MDSSLRVENDGGLILDPPHELKFKGPFDDFVTVTLLIKNPKKDSRVAFKIKTTAPKRYCVKPNSGILDPDGTIKVNVLLQPFQYDPQEKNKHKFMVQYIYLTEKENSLPTNDIINLWKDLPADRLYDIKLKCTFEPNGSEVQQQQQQQQQSQPQQLQSNTNGTAATPNANSNTSSTSTAPLTSSGANKVASVTSNQTSNSVTSPSIGTTHYQSIQNNDLKTTARNRNADSSNSNKYDNTFNELKDENERLKKEIDRLKEEETRLRKMALQDTNKKSQHISSGSGGGSSDLIQLINNKSIWIIIALLSIILYLLFIKS